MSDDSKPADETQAGKWVNLFYDCSYGKAVTGEEFYVKIMDSIEGHGQI